MSLSVKTQGGTGGMTASIFVTGLSEADIVTASYGDKTKTAVWNSEANRHEITKIKDFGMWTVTATNGEDTVTQGVLIDTAAEFEVEMAFEVNYLMLYDCGDECEDETGGYTVFNYDGNPTNVQITKAETSITLKNTNTTSSWVTGITTVNTFSPSDYSHVCLNVVDYTLGTSGKTYAGSLWADHVAREGFECAIYGTGLHIMGVSDKITQIQPYTFPYYMGCTVTFNAWFLVKADPIAELCSKAGLSAPADLATLIADTASITTILASEAAAKYMVSKCTGDFMASFVASSDCLSALNASPYKSVILANKHWHKFLSMVGVTA